MIYVVVCSAFKGSYQEEAEDWLSQLDKYAPGCPVIVLLNVAVDKDKPLGFEEYDCNRLAEHNKKFKDDKKAGNAHHYRIAAIKPSYDDGEISQTQFGYSLSKLDENWKMMRDDILLQAFLVCDNKKIKAGEMFVHNQEMTPRRTAVGLGLLLNGCKELGCPYIFKERDALHFLNDIPGQPSHPHFEEDESNNLLNLLIEREVLFRIPSNDNGGEVRLLIVNELPEEQKLSENAKNRIYRDFRGNRDVMHYRHDVQSSVPQNLHLYLIGKTSGILNEDCLWKYGAVFEKETGDYAALIEIGNFQNRIDIWIIGPRYCGDHNDYLDELIKVVAICVPDKHGSEQLSSDEKLLFTENVINADRTITPVDCEANYRKAIESEAEGNPIHVRGFNFERDMDPAVILHHRNRKTSTLISIWNKIHGIIGFLGTVWQDIQIVLPLLTIRRPR